MFYNAFKFISVHNEMIKYAKKIVFFLTFSSQHLDFKTVFCMGPCGKKGLNIDLLFIHMYFNYLLLLTLWCSLSCYTSCLEQPHSGNKSVRTSGQARGSLH